MSKEDKLPLFWQLEHRFLLDEVGGDASRLGIALIAFNTPGDNPKFFWALQLDKLLSGLVHPPRIIVGYGTHNYFLPALKGFIGADSEALAVLRTRSVDLAQVIESSAGYRLPLSALAAALKLEGGSSLVATLYFRMAAILMESRLSVADHEASEILLDRADQCLRTVISITLRQLDVVQRAYGAMVADHGIRVIHRGKERYVPISPALLVKEGLE